MFSVSAYQLGELMLSEFGEKEQSDDRRPETNDGHLIDRAFTLRFVAEARC
jgi:hypothetical protein